MKQSRITIVGSLNMDLVVKTPCIPLPGETVLGSSFTTVPGGKGNNQAVACARLGADVTLVGCVGSDIFGQQLLQNLSKEGIVTSHIATLSEVNTGVAVVIVKEEENLITVVPGANNHLTPNKIEEKEEIIKESDIILLQLEIPLETVIKTVEIAETYGVPVILNPAPSTVLPKEFFERVSVFTPNEHELTKMFGEERVDSLRIDTLLMKFPEKIVMTKGKEGAYFANNKGDMVNIPSHAVEVVDTTGAGDSFNAGLAVMLSQGKDLYEATQFAVTVGALSVMKFGAQGGMPTLGQVTDFIDRHYKLGEKI